MDFNFKFIIIKFTLKTQYVKKKANKDTSIPQGRKNKYIAVKNIDLTINTYEPTKSNSLFKQ